MSFQYVSYSVDKYVCFEGLAYIVIGAQFENTLFIFFVFIGGQKCHGSFRKPVFFLEFP